MQTLNQHDNRGEWLLIAMFILFLALMAFGCRTVSKSSSSEKMETVSVVDSIHVKKYDTSVTTHEVTEYQTKTVELYDTVWTVRDSFINRLVSRIIYTNGSHQKKVTEMGTGSDSTARKSGVVEQSIKTNKTVEKYFDWGNLLFPLMAVGIGCLIVWYGFNWLKKQYE